MIIQKLCVSDIVVFFVASQKLYCISLFFFPAQTARFGPGWVVGAIEGASGGMRNPGVHIAVTPCRLHHLPYSNIEQVETENPSLVLHLFKMMSLLSARRQEVTIDQLATLHSIINSPALTKPMSRATMGALQSV